MDTLVSAERGAASGALPAAPTHGEQFRSVRRFLLHFLEMVVVMGVGMGIYHPLVRALPPEYAAWFATGTNGGHHAQHA